jgi:hypothetical protein
MALLEECPICRDFISKRVMGYHIQARHPQEWWNSQRVARAAQAPTTKRKSIAHIEPYVDASWKQLIVQATREQEERKAKQATTNAAIAAWERSVAARRLSRPDTTVQAAPGTTTGQKERRARSGPAISKKERKRAHAYLLQTQKVSAKNSPALFDGVLHKAPPPMHTQQVVNKQNPSAVEKVSIACSCGGENERCYRCYGLGYYEVSRQRAAAIGQVSAPPSDVKMSRLATFASDSRGGSKALRENGRFDTYPAHDAYDEESSS